MEALVLVAFEVTLEVCTLVVVLAVNLRGALIFAGLVAGLSVLESVLESSGASVVLWVVYELAWDCEGPASVLLAGAWSLDVARVILLGTTSGAGGRALFGDGEFLPFLWYLTRGRYSL